MIQVTQDGLVGGRDTVSSLREQFERKRFAVLPSLLEPALLARVCEAVDRGSWDRKVHHDIGVEEVSRSAGVKLLEFLSNAPEFLELMSDITGCGPFTWFGGRIYRMRAGTDHHDSWHSDVGNGLVAMSINLSPHGFQGGVFQMRERRSEELLANVSNTGFGDALLFAISRDLAHRITPMEPGAPKVAFAGWFAAGQSDLLRRLHEMRATAGSDPFEPSTPAE